MKYLLFIFLTASCWADGFIICGTRADGSVVQWWSSASSDVSHLSAPASPTTTYFAIDKATWTATNTDADDGVPVLRVIGNRVFNRAAAAITAERAIAARVAAKKMFLAWRQTLTTARQSLALSPGDPFFQSQVSQAASMVTSYASAASIPVTTATTQ